MRTTLKMATVASNLAISLLFLSFCVIIRPTHASEAPKVYGWGGGGAFTSYFRYLGNTYLASDVAGVWKQENGHWKPYVEGLGNYNVTKLTSFNNKLIAITTDTIFESDGVGPWRAINIKINTYRSETDHPVVQVGELMCIASRRFKVQCVDTEFNEIEFDTPIEKIKGLQIVQGKPNELFVFGDNSLYLLKMKSGKTELVREFPSSVISMPQIAGKQLVATAKGIYELNAQNNKPFYEPKSGSIVNCFAGTSADRGGVIYIGQGNRWTQKLYAFSLTNDGFDKLGRINVQMDKRFPHRKYQTWLTKFLDVYKSDHQIWITDYWGVYQLTGEQDDMLEEVTDDAINTVSTDLFVSDQHIFVSTMDVGLVKVERQSSTKNEFQLLTPHALRGHAWSMLYLNDRLTALFSPWNKADDYLVEYSEVDEAVTSRKLTDFRSRESKGAFWGKGYARQLFYYHGLGSVRDGVNGGFVYDSESNKQNIHIEVGDRNRVFRAISEFNGELYTATCDSHPGVYVFNQYLEQISFIRAPAGFCPFSVQKARGSLYFLGSRSSNSEVYVLNDNQLEKVFSTPKGSAFYALAANPSALNELVVATTTWSNKATSALFVSIDGGNSFIDNSCLLTHRNGVVRIIIKDGEGKVFIQQKVGGGIEMSTELLFSESACT